MKIKAGLGYDIHRLVEGRPLYLGGINIPYTKGLLGHSDGDCLIHAVVDSLLGALGEKDIGQLFPDTDPAYRGKRSTEILSEVVERMKKRKGRLQHIDTIVIAEEPHLAPFIPKMKDVMGRILSIAAADLGIKAKTNEGIGALGQGKAIAALAHAIILFPDSRS